MKKFESRNKFNTIMFMRYLRAYFQKGFQLTRKHSNFENSHLSCWSALIDIGSFGLLTKSGNVEIARETPCSPRVRVRRSAVQHNADLLDMYSDWLIDQLMTSAVVSRSCFKFTIAAPLRKSWWENERRKTSS